MKIHNVLQRGDEWDALRAGIPTASEFGRIVTPAQLKFAAGAETYACEIVARRLGVASPEGLPSFWMDYGTEMEPYAFAEFSRTVAAAELVGFVTTDDGKAGGSPDGLVGDNAVLETKCPKAETLIAWHSDGGLPREHLLQVHGLMWVCQREWAHFYAWHPELEPFHLLVQYDDKVFKALDEAIPRFCELVDEIQGKVTRRNAFGFNFEGVSHE